MIILMLFIFNLESLNFRHLPGSACLRFCYGAFVGVACVFSFH